MKKSVFYNNNIKEVVLLKKEVPKYIIRLKKMIFCFESVLRI